MQSSICLSACQRALEGDLSTAGPGRYVGEIFLMFLKFKKCAHYHSKRRHRIIFASNLNILRCDSRQFQFDRSNIRPGSRDWSSGPHMVRVRLGTDYKPNALGKALRSLRTLKVRLLDQFDYSGHLHSIFVRPSIDLE